MICATFRILFDFQQIRIFWALFCSCHLLFLLLFLFPSFCHCWSFWWTHFICSVHKHINAILHELIRQTTRIVNKLHRNYFYTLLHVAAFVRVSFIGYVGSLLHSWNSLINKIENYFWIAAIVIEFFIFFLSCFFPFSLTLCLIRLIQLLFVYFLLGEHYSISKRCFESKFERMPFVNATPLNKNKSNARSKIAWDKGTQRTLS